MKKQIFLFAWLVLLISCQSQGTDSSGSRLLPVRVLTVTTDTTISTHTYVAEVVEQSSVDISPLAAGRVLNVLVHQGDKVHAGQTLMCIDSTQAVNARRSAEALLRQAEDGFTRASALYKEGGITQQKYVEIETQLSQAQSMLMMAARAVEDCRVVAPVDGLVGRSLVQVGQSVAPGEPLIRLMNLSGLKVKFAVPESEITHIRLGDKAQMWIPAIGEKRYMLTITEKSLIPNRIAHSFEVTASVSTTDPLLPGMMAKVQMESDKTVGFVLPQNCIQLLPNGANVWIADDSVAIRRTILVGQYVHDGVLIADGLQRGDKVIVEGYQKLYQNAKITY